MELKAFGLIAADLFPYAAVIYAAVLTALQFKNRTKPVPDIVTFDPAPPQKAPVSQNLPPTATSTVPTVPESGLSWLVPKQAYKLTRIMADEMGLTLAQKNTLCACIYQESGFKNGMKYSNKDPKTGQVWSTDWGICQINDYWNIGPGKPFPSVKYVLDNPDKCVRWMIKMQKAGKLNLWSSYKLGHYKKWLSPDSPMWKLKS